MSRFARIVVTVLAIAALTATAALAAKPKPRSSYNDGKSGVSIQTGVKSTISTFSGSCPGGSDPKYVFATLHTTKVKKHGKFHLDTKVSVNTVTGKTLRKKRRLTVNGRFVTKIKAKGSFKLHVDGCKNTKFKATLDSSSEGGS